MHNLCQNESIPYLSHLHVKQVSFESDRTVSHYFFSYHLIIILTCHYECVQMNK